MATPVPAPPSVEVIADLPLERLSVQAQGALDSAFRIAAERGDAYLGSEHLLLGILRQPDSVGALALQSLGVTEGAVLKRLEKAFGQKGAAKPSSPVMTSRTMNALLESIASQAELPLLDTGVLTDAVIQTEGIGTLFLRDARITPERWTAARGAVGAARQEHPSGESPVGTAGLFIHRGYARLMIERPEEARVDFATALESAATDHQMAIAANNVAWTDLYLGDQSRFPAALELADRAVQKLPNVTAISGTRAYALIENGRTQEGLDHLVALGVQDDDDQITGNRACCLAVGLARVGNRAYAEVLIEVAGQLRAGPRLMARARQELARSTQPAKTAAAVPTGAVMASVHSVRLHPPSGTHVIVLGGINRRVLPMSTDQSHAERLIRLLKTPTEPLAGRREWIELMLAVLESRNERITAVFLDRMVDEQYYGAAVVRGHTEWSFAVRPSDAGVIALLTRLPIAIDPELWNRYSLADPFTQSAVRRWLGAVFRKR